MSAFSKTAVPKSRKQFSSIARRSAGFIQGVILFGIALLAVVIAAFSMSNRTSSTSTSSEEAKTAAGTVISAGNQIKAAADRFATDRGDLSAMTFESTSPNGLFNATDNFISPPQIPVKAYNGGTFTPIAPSTTGNGYFYIKKGAAVDSITSAVIATTGPLSEATCQRINNSLFRNSNIPAKLTTGTDASIKGGTGAVTIPAGHFGANIPFEEGCINAQGTGNLYYYFKVIGRG